MQRNYKIIGGSIALVVLVTTMYVVHATNEFQKALDSYSQLAKSHSDAAYIPGVADNPIRQRLNSILSQVLARPMTPKERMTLAQEGLDVLKEGEKQMDDIGTIGEKVQIAIQYLEEKNSSPGALFVKSKGASIATLARQEFSIVADIRGLSYRANFHTAEIFNRIILDRGELTKAYSDELNNQIPAVEEQFNKRANLYNELKSVTAKMDKFIQR